MKATKNFLFLDCETTGKDPKTARLVQVAAILRNTENIELERYVAIMKPEDFLIPDGAINIHGITNEKAKKKAIAKNRN